jgi:hypothetical protein
LVRKIPFPTGPINHAPLQVQMRLFSLALICHDSTVASVATSMVALANFERAIPYSDSVSESIANARQADSRVNNDPRQPVRQPPASTDRYERVNSLQILSRARRRAGAI